MYSVDTNIVFGMISADDQCHSISIAFCKDHKKGFLLLRTVMAEFKKVFLKKFNLALTDIQAICITSTSAERTALLDDWTRKKPKLSEMGRNIISQLNTCSPEEFASIHQESLKLLTCFPQQLESILENKIQISRTFDELNSNQKEFLSLINKINFVHSKDKEVFTEFMLLCFGGIDLNSFFTLDKKFSKQISCNKAVFVDALDLSKIEFYLIEKSDTKSYELVSC